MVRHPLQFLIAFTWSLAVSATLALSADEAAVSFGRDVQPLLARHCFSCHGPTVHEAGLRLDEPTAALAELDSGEHAIVPGQVDQSELITRVSAADESERMPPKGKPLSAQEIDALKAWIAEGAKWEKHWAFVPPERHMPPKVSRPDWVKNPIDAFILAGLDQAGLEPAPAADKRTLVRRAYFNVTGLPPSSEAIDAFLADDRPDAYGRLIDSLLASSHYGEHWARHWLDLVRFAETNSFERDGDKPNAWKYRDYVIHAFNDDKPYDQFIREQLAGDELDHVTDDSMIATGYYRLGTWDDEPADPLQSRFDEFDDIISTTSQVMLGLTVGCARCHNHKIDPIPQADYYGLLAFFADVTPYADPSERDPSSFSQWDMSKPAERAHRARLRQQVELAKKELRAMEEVGIARMPTADQEIARTPDRDQLLNDKLEKALNVSEWNLYQEKRKRHDGLRDEMKHLPTPSSALALARCNARPEPTHILLRGNAHAPGDLVAPHFPAVFGDPPPVIPIPAAGAHSAGRRRVLADWIASPSNMLTARVIVNRVWQHQFGRGLVRTPNNFGELGTPPTHPELLDFLALWFVDHHWQIKPLQRLIMTSNAYRMSSAGNPKGLAQDPTNDLFWRFDMRRLSAEEIRDAMLIASGQFNPKAYGPSFYPTLSQEVLATQSRPGEGWHQSSPEEQSRRGIYIYVKRSLLTPLLTAFDFPDVDASCEARFVTTNPGQALALLNGDFANAQAARLAERVAAKAGHEPRAQVAAAIEFALQRPAKEAEIVDGLELIHHLSQDRGLKPADALKFWCLTVLNLNEFVYLD
jgi:mono/diheme cytochrome c family protein